MDEIVDFEEHISEMTHIPNDIRFFVKMRCVNLTYMVVVDLI